MRAVPGDLASDREFLSYFPAMGNANTKERGSGIERSTVEFYGGIAMHGFRRGDGGEFVEFRQFL